MARLKQDLRRMLKKPLGKVATVKAHLKTLKGKKIVAVGDETVLKMLGLGKRPHVAVFDFKVKRKRIAKEKEQKLRRAFPKVLELRNPKGTISKRLMLLAPEILMKGWAVKISGEEDLAAIPLIVFSDRKTAVLYGQPDKGCVLVGEKGKQMAEKALALIFSD